MNRNERIRFLAAGAIVLLAMWDGAAPMSAAEPGPKTTIPLTDLAQPAAALAHLDARVEVARTQASANDGLQLDVIFRNDGEEAVRLLDPHDTTDVLLLDAEGWPIELPRVAPEALINRAGEKLAAKIIVLEPDQEVRLALAIREVLPRAVQGAETPRDPQPIRAGAYDVKVLATLIAADAGANGIRASRTFITPVAFTVHLGN